MQWNRLWSALALAGLMLTSAQAFAQDDSQQEPPPEDDYEAEEEAPPTEQAPLASPTEAAEEAPPSEEPEAAPEPVEDEPVEQDDTSPRELEDTDYFFLGAFARAIIIPGFHSAALRRRRHRRDQPRRRPRVHLPAQQLQPGGQRLVEQRRRGRVLPRQRGSAHRHGVHRGQPRRDLPQRRVPVVVPGRRRGHLRHRARLRLGLRCHLRRTRADRGHPRRRRLPSVHRPGRRQPWLLRAPRARPLLHTNGGTTTAPSPTGRPTAATRRCSSRGVALPHVAVRIKPIRQIQIRVDGGYGLYNFFVGGSVAYGF